MPEFLLKKFQTLIISRVLFFTCLYLIISQNYLQNKGLKPIELYIAIILVIGLGDSLIIFADQEDKLLYSNWVLIINSSIAAGIAIYVTLSEKNNHNHLKANIFLVLGLGLWFLANTIWAYYEVVLHLMAPVPSLADVLLLMAYSILISRLVISTNVYQRNLVKNLSESSLLSLEHFYCIFLALPLIFLLFLHHVD